MTNPLAGFLKPQGGNPLESFLGSSEDGGLATATGRMTAEQQNIRDNIEKLKAIREHTTSEHQATIDAEIAAMEKQLEGWTHPVTRGASDIAQGISRGVSTAIGGQPLPTADIENVARGAATGIATGPVHVAELAATIPKIASVIPGVPDIGKGLRESLSERARLITETIDPQGAGGLIGEFAGETPAQMAMFGGLTKFLPAPVQKLLEAPVQGGLAKRVAVGAARSAGVAAPVSALQTIGMENATPEERLKQFAMGEAGAAAFGAFSPAKAGGAGGKVGEVPLDALKSVEVPVLGKDELASRQGELDKLNEQAAADRAAKEAEKQTRRMAQAEWTLANPTKSWKGDLNNTERKAILTAFKEKQPAVVSTEQPTTIPVEQQAATIAQTDLDHAQAGGNPDAVQAAETKVAAQAQIAQLTEETRGIAKQFVDPALPPEAKNELLATFKYKVDQVRQLGGLTAGLDDAYANMRKVAGMGAGMEGAPVNGETAAPLMPAESSPTLDKPMAGISPAIAAVKQRMDLRKAFTDMGLPWNEDAPTDVLMRQLNAKIADTKSIAPPVDRAEPTTAPTTDLLAEKEAVRMGLKSEVSHEVKAFAKKLRQEVHDRAAVQELIGPENNPSYNAVTGDAQFNVKDKMVAKASSVTLSAWKALSDSERLDILKKSGRGWSAHEGQSAEKAWNLMPKVRQDKIASIIQGKEPSPTPTPSPSGTGPSPTQLPAPHAVAVVEPSQTFLSGIKHDVPLEKMTPNQLDKMETLVADGIEEAGADKQLRSQLMSDMKTIRTETARRTAEASASPRPYKELTPEDIQTQRDALEMKVEDLTKAYRDAEGDARATTKTDLTDAKARLADLKAEISTRKIEARTSPKQVTPAKSAEAIPEEKVFSPADFRKAPSKLGDAALDAQIDEIHSRMSILDPKDAETWSKRLSKLMEEKALRAEKNTGPDDMPPISGGDELRLQSHPAVGSFLGGFTYGLLTPQKDDTDEQYLSRAFMWGLGSAGLVMGAKYLSARMKAIETPKPSVLGTEGFPKVVHSVDDMTGVKIGPLTRLRQFYQGTVRATDGIERVPINRDLPTHKNPGKLAAMYGSYAARAERWLTSKVTWVDSATGEPQPMMIDGREVLPLQAVLDMAQGDKEALGNLAVAYASAEGAGKRAVPMDQVQRETLIRNAPDYLVNAVKELRRYNAAGLVVMNKTGRLSDAGFAAAMSEQWYTPLYRVIQQMEGLTKNDPNFKGSPNALFARKGGTSTGVRNPYDVSVEMTARILRAAEYGNIIEQFVQRAEELPSTVRQSLIEPIGKQMNPKALETERAVAELRKLTSISEADAKGMLTYMDSDAINETPGIITHWRNGELQSYRVNSEIFKAIKSLAPPEVDMFWRMLGAPARLASKGVVYHPGFTEYQFIVDSWTAMMNSKYGFRPGIDSVRGWWADFTGSPAYKKLMDVGGPTSLQSLKYIQKGAVEAVEIAGESAARTAWNNVKELKLWEAYKAVLLPVANGARVGEYLRALDHGASTLEAAYAAQSVLGNFKMQGYFNGMRIFNMLTMFSRPAIAAMDATLEASGMHPYRTPEYSKTGYGQKMQQAGVNPRIAASLSFMTKGFVGIALPTAMIWNWNKDDEEISQLRRTELGSRYWFFRADDKTIVKVRRPQVLGEVFGASMEAALDKMYSDDPKGTERMLAGLWDDAALNVMPQIGVIPYSLWANKSVGLGSPLVPGKDDKTDPAMQGRENATLPSRIVADKMADISAESTLQPLRTALSPAGLDYIFGTFAGMLGQDALRGLNAALVYKDKGFLPAKEELPILARLLSRYPSMNVKEAQEFYDRDVKVQAAAGTVKDYLTQNPTMLGDYYTHNMDRIQLIKIHEEVRQKTADMRRAIDDLKNAPQGLIDKDVLDETTKQFTSIILQHMKIANDFAKMLEKK